MNKEENVKVLLNKIQQANAAVALVCNHQKKVSKSFDNQIAKLDEQIKNQQDKIKGLGSRRGSTRRKRASRGKRSRSKSSTLKTAREKLKELKIRKQTKIDMKNVSVNTSKSNYIDPRIIMAFIKKNGIDSSKVFNKSQQQKFIWAADVDPTWKF